MTISIETETGLLQSDRFRFRWGAWLIRNTGNTGNTGQWKHQEQSQKPSDWLRFDFLDWGYSLGHRKLRTGLRHLRIETDEKGGTTGGVKYGTRYPVLVTRYPVHLPYSRIFYHIRSYGKVDVMVTRIAVWRRKTGQLTSKRHIDK